MKKLVKKISVYVVMVCLVMTLFGTTSQAASGSISMSGGSATVGGTVTVKCTVSCSSGPIGGAQLTLKYDASALEYTGGAGGVNGGGGSITCISTNQSGTDTSLSYSIKFKVLKEGSYSVSTTSAKVYDINMDTISVGSSSATVKGTIPEADPPSDNGGNSNNGGSTNNGGTTTTPDEDDDRDSNNKLSGLLVSPGTLAPAFSAGTTSYTVTVPSDTTQITISATAASDKAKVSVSGGKDLKLGENTAKVVVTAENGSTKVYNLTIICGEVEKIDINGVTNTINEGFSDEQIPSGFTRTKVTYNERQYEAVANASGMQLLYLSNDAGSAFYIYDGTTQSFAPFTQIGLSEGKYIIPMPLDETDAQFAGYEQVALTINDKSVMAWKLDEEFSVLKVMNQAGEVLYYKYDSVDGTYQRHVEIQQEEAGVIIEGNLEDVVEPEPFYVTYSQYLMLGAGAVAILFIILTIVLGVKLRKANAYEEDEDELYEEVSSTESKDAKAEQIEEKIDNPDDDWDV